jgi:hypothetical protein
MFEVFLWCGRWRVSNTTSIWFPPHSVVVFMAILLGLECPEMIVPVVLYASVYCVLDHYFSQPLSSLPLDTFQTVASNKCGLVLGRSTVEPSFILPMKGEAKCMSPLILESMQFHDEIEKIYPFTSVASKRFPFIIQVTQFYLGCGKFDGMRDPKPFTPLLAAIILMICSGWTPTPYHF